MPEMADFRFGYPSHRIVVVVVVVRRNLIRNLYTIWRTYLPIIIILENDDNGMRLVISETFFRRPLRDVYMYSYLPNTDNTTTEQP